MVDKIEMSLDDIIKTNKISFRRGGATGNARKANNANNARNGGGGGGGRRNNAPATNFRGRQSGGGAGAGKGRAPVRGGVQQARSKFPRVSTYS